MPNVLREKGNGEEYPQGCPQVTRRSGGVLQQFWYKLYPKTALLDDDKICVTKLLNCLVLIETVNRTLH